MNSNEIRHPVPFFTTLDEYCLNFHKAELFDDLIQRIIEKIYCKKQKVQLVETFPEQYPYFIIQSHKLSIKLFGGISRKIDYNCFEQEKQIFLTILNQMQNLFTAIPKLIHKGSSQSLLKINQSSKHDWYYIIMTQIDGRSIRTCMKDNRYFQFDFQLIVIQLSQYLKLFHIETLKIKKQYVFDDSTTPRLQPNFFIKFIQKKYDFLIEKLMDIQLFTVTDDENLSITYIENEFGNMPERLLRTVPEYFKRFFKERVKFLSKQDDMITFIHGSFNVDHIFLELRDKKVYTVSGFIEFTDCKLFHIYYELIYLHFSTFQYNKAHLRLFIEKYGLKIDEMKDFIYDMMCLTLLHQYNIMVNDLHENLQIDFSKIVDLDELAARLWDFDQLQYTIQWINKREI